MKTKNIKIPDRIKEYTNDILNNTIKYTNNYVNDDDNKKIESEEYHIEDNYVNENMEYEIISGDQNNEIFDDDKKYI